jgi:hypothetical protein
MVRTCNGLELRDPSIYAETAAAMHELGAPDVPHLVGHTTSEMYPPPPMEHEYGPARSVIKQHELCCKLTFWVNCIQSNLSLKCFNYYNLNFN